MEDSVLMNQQNGEDLYKVATMADGARNTGYRSTYNAIDEIVDNSIESCFYHWNSRPSLKSAKHSTVCLFR